METVIFLCKPFIQRLCQYREYIYTIVEGKIRLQILSSDYADVTQQSRRKVDFPEVRK
jgi:hypothetical protein